MNKKVLKIFITIILIIVAVTSYLLLTKPNNEGKGEFVFELIDKDNNTLISETISFSATDTLLTILDAKYDIRYENSSFGALLYDINQIKTDFKNSYLAIYINGEYANVGISSVKLEDGMRITIVEVLL